MRPNVMLIMVDQMRRDCLGIAGNPVIETPHLDHMAGRGVLFTRAYSATPSCIPARAALFTGMDAKGHGRHGYQDGVPWNYPNMLAEAFTQGGYHTQAVGKMHVFPERSLCGFHNVVLHDGYLHHNRNRARAAGEAFEAADDYLHWLRREMPGADLPDSGMDCNAWTARPWPYEERLHPTNWCASESIDFLRRRDPRRPFFLFTSFVRPHSPLDPPQYYYDLYDRQTLPPPPIGDWAELEDAGLDGTQINCNRGLIPPCALARARAAYYGHITHIDHQIGRMLQALQEYGALHNTVFLFTSDHGDLLGDHNLFRKALPYEGSSGIPLLLYDPGDVLGLPRGATSDALCELRDVMPTLLEAAGLPVPDTVTGQSLLSVAGGKPAPWRSHLHGEHAYGEQSNHWIVTRDHKYIWYERQHTEQLFDLSRDPQECHDLHADPAYAGVLAHHRALLQEALRQG